MDKNLTQDCNAIRPCFPEQCCNIQVACNGIELPLNPEVIETIKSYVDPLAEQIDALDAKIEEGYEAIEDAKEINAKVEKLQTQVEVIADEIVPLTPEEIDELWIDTPGTGENPEFTMTPGFVPVWNGSTFEDGIELDKIGNGNVNITIDQFYKEMSANPQSGTAVADAIAALNNKLEEKLLNFRYFSVPAGKYYPLKRNGTYMIYNGKDANGTEQNISLVRRAGDTWENICTNAQQLSLTTPTVAVDGRYTYQLCGIAYTGTSVIGIPTTEGFRRASNNYAYITSAGEMHVCESVQGLPLNIKDTVDACAGKSGDPYNFTKILFIGNSFSQDVFMPLSEIFYTEGHTNYLFGLCKKEGSSAPDHANNIANGVADYHYYESTANNKGTYSNPFGRDDSGSLKRVAMDQILKEHNWDYVFIQSGPPDFISDTVSKDDRQKIANYIRKLAPGAKIGYSCSWLAPHSDDESKLQSLTGIAKTWYEAYVAKAGKEAKGRWKLIYDAVKDNILTDGTYRMIASFTTPVYYANQILGKSSDALYRDTLHMGALGRVLVGYTFYAQFMQTFRDLDALSDVGLKKYVLGNYTITSADKNMILESVNYTLQSPWIMPTKRVEQNN